MKDYIIYDLEIKKAIPTPQGKELGIEYCEGWRDHNNMGISVMGVYDSTQRKYLFFDDFSKEAFKLLCKNKVCIGFNNINFDNRVIASAWGQEFVPETCFDILREVWLGLQLNPDAFDPKTHSGYGLDALCQKNIGLTKTGNGAFAPVLWQKQRYAELYSYCLNDVMITHQLLEYLYERGGLRNPKNGNGIKININPLR